MAKLTAPRRNALPSSDFALPGKGKGKNGKGSGAYPVDTPGRARAALSRGAHNASSSELASIKRKVHAKYPDMKIGGKLPPHHQPKGREHPEHHFAHGRPRTD